MIIEIDAVSPDLGNPLLFIAAPPGRLVPSFLVRIQKTPGNTDARPAAFLARRDALLPCSQGFIKGQSYGKNRYCFQFCSPKRVSFKGDCQSLVFDERAIN